MKKITAIILLALCAVCALSGCKSEADMVETMISTMIPTETQNNNDSMQNSGTVTDGDGVIGNDNQESSANQATSEVQNTNGTSVAGDNVL